MTPLRNTAVALACAAALIVPSLAASAADAVRSSFEAHSELFELVGRIKDGRLMLTLDRWASNEPVSAAKIEIEVNGQNLVARAQADGTYLLEAAPFAAPATYPLTISITAGEDSDLLAADFVVAGDNVKPAAASSIFHGPGIVAALALLAAAALLTLRRRKGESA
jgi:MYXO-CTERM domain-containing protein